MCELHCCSKKKLIYIAGPLFNSGELHLQKEIANIVETNGYKTFLPQRDGFESSDLTKKLINNGYSEKDAIMITSKIIFYYDVYNVFLSDVIVSNINGIEPDSGTVSETALAYSMGKGVVLFTNDIRTFSDDLKINPLLHYLSPLEIVHKKYDIVKFINKVLNMTKNTHVPFENMAINLQKSIIIGEKIYNAKQLYKNNFEPIINILNNI